MPTDLITWLHRVLIVTAADQAFAQNLAKGIAGTAADNMWTTPLSPTGALPATHYVSSGVIASDMAFLLENPDALVAASGGAVTLEQATGLLSRSIIKDADPFAVFAEVGLKMITESI